MKKLSAIVLSSLLFVLLFTLVSCNLNILDKISNANSNTNNSDEKTNTSTNNEDNDINNEGNDTPNNSHSHNYGEWSVVKEATCIENGIEERECNCGIKESRYTSIGHSWSNATCTEASTCVTCQTTNGDPLGHTTDCGVCSRCGIEYYSPYQLALKELNEEYERQRDDLISLKASISVKEDILRSVLNDLGISYLNTKSYYNNQLTSIETQLSNKLAQRAIAMREGNMSKVKQLDIEIDELSDQYQTCYQAISLCEDQEEIDQLKAKYERLSYSIERDYQQRLNEINNMYN